METEEEDDTNDEDFNLEIRQFSSCSHRFSKVSKNYCIISMCCLHKHFATSREFGNNMEEIGHCFFKKCQLKLNKKLNEYY